MTYGSLFSGIGGLDLGLDRAGMECRWQVEIDPFCQAVLEKHWPGVKRYGDIHQLTGNELEPVDLICGGFPCQDLSQAGKRAGIEGTRSSLWFEYARIIGVVRPRYVLIENVPGLLVPGAMRRVVGELARLGYVGCWRCLRASDFRASHLRKRVFIVAYSSEAEPFRIGGLFDGEREARRNDANGRDKQVAHTWIRRGRGREIDASGERWDEFCDSSETVAYREIRGLRELRQSSGGDGLVDGSDMQLAYASRQLHNRRGGAGTDGRQELADADRTLADYFSPRLEERGCERSHDAEERATAERDCRTLAHTRGIGLEDAEIREAFAGGKADRQIHPSGIPAEGRLKGGPSAGYHPLNPSGNSLPVFAPGPSDPRWPDILAERPDLAPALAHSGHNERHTGRRDSIQERPHQQGYPARGEPAPYGIQDDGETTLESPVRGMADGLPDWLDRAMQDRTKRLGRLGNAVVPQVAEWIGKKILEIEKKGEA